MALFENFPYTNLHELNLDWLIRKMQEIGESQVISVNGETGEVILYENPTVEFPDVTLDHWSIVRLTNGTARGIMFGNDNKAYIVHGNLMYQLYGASNQPPYPVTSVNGLTGDITLFAENTVRLPDIDNISLTNWNIFRELNNVFRGIQFNDDDTESIINGQNRYQIYTSRNTPPYPVRSVNSQTGDIELFTDSNGVITFPEVNNPNLIGWILKRDINGTNCSITINNDGTMSVSAGGYDYSVYTTQDTENDIIAIPNDANTDIWGLIRDTSEGSVGILFSNSDALTTPEAYIRYVDSSNVVHTEKLLTMNDIPSASGVVSFNGLTGVVVVRGSDLIVSTSDTRTIAQAISDLAVVDYNIKNTIAYVENTDNASQNIPINSYVIWKNVLCVSQGAIAIGDTLSGTNLVALSDGGVGNDLRKKIIDKTTWTQILSVSNVSVGNTYASTGRSFTLTEAGLVRADMSFGTGRPLAIGIKLTQSNASASLALCAIDANNINDTSGLSVTALLPAGTYYIWAKTASASGVTTLTVTNMPLGV